MSRRRTAKFVGMCDSCSKPINTNYMYTYSIASQVESYIIFLCSRCWTSIVPENVTRQLYHLIRNYPMEEVE